MGDRGHRPGRHQPFNAPAAARALRQTYAWTVSDRWHACWQAGRPVWSYFKILIARAITSAPMPRDTAASVIISSLAECLIAETSVGLKAVAVHKASDR